MNERSHLLLLTIGGLALFTAITATAQTAKAEKDDHIKIELNKIENTNQGCQPLFLIDNKTDYQFESFRIDLVLFDQKGVYMRQILLDMAPLYQNKRIVTSFLLNNIPCDEIGSLLINALPACESQKGQTVDCIALLEVASKNDTRLEK